MSYGIVEIPEKGRGIVATKDLKEEEILFTETPICSAQMSWGVKLGYLACSYCMRPLETQDECIQRLTKNKISSLPKTEHTYQAPPIIKCTKRGEIFCSEKCKNEADMKYNRMLTTVKDKIEEIDDLWRDIHFPPETASIALVYRLLAMKRLDPNVAEFLESKEQGDQSFGSDVIHKMLGEQFERDLLVLSDFLQRTIEDCTDEEIKSIFKLLGQNQQGIGTCSLTSWLKNHDDEEFVDQIYDEIEESTGIDFMNNEGVGLYRIQSMLNHSCRPNAKIHFLSDSNELTVVMLDCVESGSEISISYLDECQLTRSKKTRQNYLMDNYLFKCNCERCEEEDSDAESEDDEDEDEDEYEEEESFA